MKPIKEIKVKIKGREWVVYLWTREDFEKHGYHAEALCDQFERKIHLCEGEFLTPGNVIHELLHAYAEFMVTLRGQYIKPITVEEGMCTSLGDNWAEVIRNHSKICKAFRVKGRKIQAVY